MLLLTSVQPFSFCDSPRTKLDFGYGVLSHSSRQEHEEYLPKRRTLFSLSDPKEIQEKDSGTRELLNHDGMEGGYSLRSHEEMK